MSQLDSAYDPKSYEKKIWERWMAAKTFEAKIDHEKTPYTILMPPPNITDRLHMGHGMGYSTQDVLIRYKRMKGFNACWLPGTDHAGIATQMMVEKNLAAKGISRKEIGREKFLEHCRNWKEQYGGLILDQYASLGWSCDWSKLAYTMDPKQSLAVRKIFVKLFEDGLIYRGERLVNWDCALQTAVSDDEIENKEVTGSIWYIRYPVEGEQDRFITIATTRPETLLGDTAVAVHPDDERYQDLIGKSVRLPLVDRLIPIVADDYVKSEFGSGAVKITPAHDFNDFEIGKRHNLPSIDILDDEGKINGNAPKAYQGLDREVARKQVLKDIEALELLDKVEKHKNTQPISDRSKTIIEPKLSKQWFVKMDKLAAKAAKKAQTGELSFFPDAWKKTYLYWLDNIQDWCISRQLWWGHRIPIWYCDDCDGVSTGMADPQSCGHCGSEGLRQDEDVLDTWFSSWLWPLSPFGWPPETPEEQAQLDYFYPSNVLVTGAEIIFLWVARMIMVGLYVKDELAFKDVYFNAIVCDKKGRKMSKTLGNGIDPMDVVDKFGADAVRFTAISLAPLGGRVRMAMEDFENGSKFCNKIWNAYRFILPFVDPKEPLKPLAEVNLPASGHWLLKEYQQAAKVFEKSIDNYRINDALDAVYQFVWGSVCDWGIECAKDALKSHDKAAKDAHLSVMLYVMEGALRLCHPVMPFITEELWHKLPAHPDAPKTTATIATAAFPTAAAIPFDKSRAEEFEVLKALIGTMRSKRSEAKIPPKHKLTAHVAMAEAYQAALSRDEAIVKSLANLDAIVPLTEQPSQALFGLGQGFKVYLPVAGLLDIPAEQARIKKDIARLEKVVQGYDKKLGNANFVKNAPPEVIEETEGKRAQMTSQIEALSQNLASLS